MNFMKMVLLLVGLMFIPFSTLEAADVLVSVNQRRGFHHRYAFKPHPALYLAAQTEANAMARRGSAVHIGGSGMLKRYVKATKYGAGVGPGVRWDIAGLHFNSCLCMNQFYTHAGAATAMDRHGRVYNSLMLARGLR